MQSSVEAGTPFKGGGERMYTDFQTGESPPCTHGTCQSAHLAPVAQLCAVGRARTVPAARDRPNVTSAEDLEVRNLR